MKAGKFPLLFHHSSCPLTPVRHAKLTFHSFEPYDPEEPAYDDDIEPEPFDGVEPEEAKTPGAANGGENHMLTADPDARTQAGENVVNIGDPSATRGQKVGDNSVKGIKEKKIPDEKRTTTPYMTKYERARVLGTRALQIRWVLLSRCPENKCEENGNRTENEGGECRNNKPNAENTA